MAEKVSLAKLNLLQKKLETAQKRVAKIREVADDKVEHVVRATEVAASAFAIGAATAYMKKDTIANVPVPLAAAVLLHGAGLFGIGGDMKGHLHAFGDGALAAAAFTFGKNVGQDPSKFMQGITGGPAKTLTSGQRLSDDELARLAAGV